MLDPSLAPMIIATWPGAARLGVGMDADGQRLDHGTRGEGDGVRQREGEGLGVDNA